MEVSNDRKVHLPETIQLTHLKMLLLLASSPAASSTCILASMTPPDASVPSNTSMKMWQRIMEVRCQCNQHFLHCFFTELTSGCTSSMFGSQCILWHSNPQSLLDYDATINRVRDNVILGEKNYQQMHTTTYFET